MSQSQDRDVDRPKKLRTACDTCHQAKMKCSGGNPCSACRDSRYKCFYSVSNRIGRPKGTKNKRTLERISRNQSDNELDQTANNTQDAGIRMQDPCILPGLMAPRRGTEMSSIPGVNAIVNSALASIVSYPPPNATPFEQLPGSFDPPYDSGSAALCNLEVSSLYSSYDSGAFMSDDVYRLPHDDSAYVSPTSIFHDNRSAGNGFDFSSLEDKDSGAFNAVKSIPCPSPTSSAFCSCVQNHAELVFSLKDLEQRHTKPRLDVVLSAAQRALVHWKDVIECRVCQHDGNEEVLMLSAMSIRTVLGAISSLCTDYYSHFVPGGEALGKKQSMVTTPDGMRSAIGFYEITGNERMAVTDLLISRTLDKVKYTLMRFKERIETVKAKNPAIGLVSASERPYFGQSKVEHDVETLSMGEMGGRNCSLQVWQNLETTVQILEDIMRKVSASVSTSSASSM